MGVVSLYQSKKHDINNEAKKKFPDAGEILKSSQWKEGGWIEKKSRGRLTIPADNFLEKIKKWENKFLSFHGESINMEPEPIERLVKKSWRMRSNHLLQFI